MSALIRSLATLILVTIVSTPALAQKPKWALNSDSTIVDFAVGISGEPFGFDSNGEDFDISCRCTNCDRQG